jgi:tetratricopeptide (TPR) repeat protein
MKAVAKQTTVKACSMCKKTKLSTGERLRTCLCRTAFYCSQACQKRDWRVHKHTCAGRSSRRKRQLLPAQKQCQEAVVKAMRCAETGDHAGEGRAYGDLGNAYDSLGQFDTAVEFYEKHLAIALEVGDRAGEGKAYCNLGIAYRSLGQFDKALEFHERHLAIALEVGDRAGEGRAYGNLGNAYMSLGQFDKAFEFHERHLAVALEVGDRDGEGNAYGNIGTAYST